MALQYPRYGLLDLRDTTLVQLRIGQIGDDRLAEFLQAELQMYNAIADELMGGLTFDTQDWVVRFGAQGGGEMLPADEYSRQDVQHVAPGYSLGFPLRRYQYAIGWTRDFFRRKTVGDLVKNLDEATRADLRLIIRQIKLALFTPTNATFHDEYKGDITVRALVNADGTPIPSYDGIVFDPATHTHYTVSGGASLTDANIVAFEQNLIEHGHVGNQVLYINPQEEAQVKALSDFVAAVNPYLLQPLTTRALVSNPNDYLHILGRLRHFEVRMRNWMPPGYIFGYNEYGDGSSLNPLARRMSDLPEDNNLHIAGEDDRFPLNSQFMERWLGFGAYNRTNGVVMQVTTNGTYTAPTITG